MGISRSLVWCQLFWLDLRDSSSANRSSKLRDALPSTPAVFFPAFSWVTWRIASSLAEVDFRISFCSDRAFRLSPAWTALNTRFCCRLNKSLRNCFHGNFFQDSRFFATVSNHALTPKNVFWTAQPNYRLSYPTQRVSVSRLTYLRFDLLKTFDSFFFVPQIRLFCTVRWNQFNH